MMYDSQLSTLELGISLPIMQPTFSIVKNTHQLLQKPSTLLTEDELANPDQKSRLIAPILLDALTSTLTLGISACQIGIDVSMFVMNVDGITRICSNPQIVAASSDMEVKDETCINFPDLILPVNRPVAIVARYFNVDGVEVTEHLEGTAARVWLQGYDHCQGICFTKRVSKLKLDIAQRKLNKTKKRGN